MQLASPKQPFNLDAANQVTGVALLHCAENIEALSRMSIDGNGARNRL
jgi:hypothetical protein